MSTRVAAPRRVAYEVLRRVFEQDAWTDRLFGAVAERHRLDGRERAQAQRLAYGSVQQRGTCDHVIEALANRPIDRLDPGVLAALRLGVYELLRSRATPDHAAVDQAVELAKSAVEAEGQAASRAAAAAGLVNAVMRRAAREGDTLLAGVDDSTPEGAAVLHSYPEWLAAMWWRELGPESARSLMAAMNEPAETALRVNALKADPAGTVEEIVEAENGVERPAAVAPLDSPGALIVRGRLGEGLRKRLAAGQLVAQARASHAVVAVLDPQPGDRVLDLCAAPGIKSTAIAARLGNRGEVVAVELDPGRASRMRELCARLGASCVRVVEGDAAGVDISGGYDRILVDPPCSDLGTLAARPDARWRKSPALIERLAEVQGRVLARAAQALDDRGTLVYATCTVSARENEARIEALVGANPTIRADDLGASYPELASSSDGRFLQTRPDRDRTDGFFIARMRRAGRGGG